MCWVVPFGLEVVIVDTHKKITQRCGCFYQGVKNSELLLDNRLLIFYNLKRSHGEGCSVHSSRAYFHIVPMVTRQILSMWNSLKLNYSNTAMFWQISEKSRLTVCVLVEFFDGAF